MNNLIKLIEKSRQAPALAAIYAMELDRQLRNMAIAPFAFSAKGLADEAFETARVLGVDKLFEAHPTQHAGDAIYRAEMLAKEGKSSEAVALAFANAQGPEINGLNLIYANHSTVNSKLRLYFLNKYLGAYGLEIHLEVDGTTNFFHSIKCRQTLEKVVGPLVTVIMPVHNAEANIEQAICSLLAQSWSNLQIIIVDAGSTDNTLKKAKESAKKDKRIEVLTTPVNAGPYVGRNLGVIHARGQWLTVHDSDAWAFPDRIEQQVKAMEVAKVVACNGYMLRMNARGQVTRPSQLGPTGTDGYLQRCCASLMVQTDVFRKELGAWDTVWIGADAEMLDRIQLLQIKSTSLSRPLMLCLDGQQGFPSDTVLGLRPEKDASTELWEEYKRAYQTWHRSAGSKKIEINEEHRSFEVSPGIAVPLATVLRAAEPDMSNPKHVLLNANKIANKGNHTLATSLAESYLPADLTHTVEILRANAAVSQGDTAAWVRHFNAYLSHFNVAPIWLEGSGSVFDRLTSAQLTPINSGPLVSVIMPAWNAEKTLLKATKSILSQTWRNLELLIVDDASTDRTWILLQEIAKSDSRVKIVRNIRNVGPYVSKNIALSKASGDWITGHDADDWALPHRIESHINYALSTSAEASLMYMVRIAQDGKFSFIGPIGSFCLDGLARKALVSTLFSSSLLRNRLGFWDSFRFAADSEMVARAEAYLGKPIPVIRTIAMLCLDLETSLTNHPSTGISKTLGISETRKNYRDNWREKIKSQISKNDMFIPMLQQERRYIADKEMVVPTDDILSNLNSPWINF